jgi:hypothetical protein
MGPRPGVRGGRSVGQPLKRKQTSGRSPGLRSIDLARRGPPGLRRSTSGQACCPPDVRTWGERGAEAGRRVRAFLHTLGRRHASECSARSRERPSATVTSGCSPVGGRLVLRARCARPRPRNAVESAAPTPARTSRPRAEAGRAGEGYPQASQGIGRYRELACTREGRARRGRGWWQRGAGSQGPPKPDSLAPIPTVIWWSPWSVARCSRSGVACWPSHEQQKAARRASV